MPPNSDALITSLRTIVTAHYEKDTSPLLLSNVGVTLQQRGLWPSAEAEGKTLTKVIEDAHDPDLLIVRDKNSPAYIAVATGTTKKLVEQFIEHRAQTTTTIPDLDVLPRSVLLAFCVRQEGGKPVFLRKIPPFKYQTEAPNDEAANQFFLIDERYRRPGLKIIDVRTLTVSDRLDLQTKIAAWSRDHGVQLTEFYKSGSKKYANALERLIAAQPSGVAEKVMIPADIALILSQHE